MYRSCQILLSRVIASWGGPKWFGDHFAAYRRGEVSITGVGIAGRADRQRKTAKSTALVDANVWTVR